MIFAVKGFHSESIRAVLANWGGCGSCEAFWETATVRSRSVRAAKAIPLYRSSVAS